MLITRPEAQQRAFSDGCETLGYRVTSLPCLQILPCDSVQEALKTQLARHDTALFTSANAVRFAHRMHPFPWPDPPVHAIGAATAKALSDYNQPVARLPQAPFNSEAYLQQSSNDAPGSLLIVKGHGGRDLIQTRLTARGWTVGTVSVYKRVLPVLPADTIDELFTDTIPDIISVTSDETLANLWTLCQRHASKLQLIPLVVNSERCAQLAHNLGFQHTPLVAVPPGDQGQLACLARWKNTEFDRQQT